MIKYVKKKCLPAGPEGASVRGQLFCLSMIALSLGSQTNNYCLLQSIAMPVQSK